MSKSRFNFYESQYITKYFNFLDSLIIKVEYDALSAFGTGTTEEEIREISQLLKTSEAAGEAYVLAMYKRDTIFNYRVSLPALQEAGVDRSLIDLFTSGGDDTTVFFRKLTGNNLNKILEYYRNKTISEYRERNPYYLALNGEPANESEVVIIEDLYDGGFFPINEITESTHPRMYAYLTLNDNEKLNEFLNTQRANGKDFAYFNYLTTRIPYHVSRDADNFSILYADKNILSTEDLHSFYSAYHASRQYVLEVPYIQAYSKTEELYDRFIGQSILFLATLRFISSQMGNYLRNVFPARWEKRLFLQQYKLEDLVDIIDDDTILNEIISHVDELVALKGSESIISKILEIFGNTDIDVYKYLLVKTVKCDSITKDILYDPSNNRTENYDISLVKVPINVVDEAKSLAKYVTDKSQHVALKELALNDAYFGTTATTHAENQSDPKAAFITEVENILKKNEQFSMFYTKYLGIVTHVNASKNLIQSVYLFSTAIMSDQNTMNTVVPSDLLIPDVTVRDLLAAINWITCTRHDMSDEIIQDVSAVSQFIGFNPNPSLDDLKAMDEYTIRTGDASDDYVVKLPSLVSEDDIFIVKKPSEAGSIPDEFQKPNDAMTAYYYNLSLHDELLSKMENEKDYNRWLGLKQIFNYNMYSKAILDTFGGYSTFTEYLNSRDNELMEYIKSNIDAATGGEWYDNDGNTTEEFRVSSTALITKFLTVILNVLDAENETSNAALGTYVDAVLSFSKIMNTIELFKHYTVSFQTTEVINTINDPKDCLIKLFDFVSNELGSGDLRDTITLYLFDRVEDTGIDASGTKILLRHTAGDTSDGSGETQISVDHSLGEESSEEIPLLLQVWDILYRAHSTESQHDDLKLKHSVDENPTESPKDAIQLENKLEEDSNSTEIPLLLQVWDKILDHSRPKIEEKISLKHDATSDVKTSETDSISMIHNLNEINNIIKGITPIQTYDTVSDIGLKDIETNIKVYHSLVDSSDWTEVV